MLLWKFKARDWDEWLGPICQLYRDDTLVAGMLLSRSFDAEAHFSMVHTNAPRAVETHRTVEDAFDAVMARLTMHERLALQRDTAGLVSIMTYQQQVAPFLKEVDLE